eukprot:gene3991-4992_t
MGGSPLTLFDLIQKELDKMKKASIKPFFVFNGLSILKDRGSAGGKSNSQISRSQKLSTAWDSYYRGQYNPAAKYFQEAEKNIYSPFIHTIINYFKQKGIEFFKAPFFAGAQLAYFSDPTQRNYLNAVWGAHDLLLFGVYRLIVDIDYEKGVFEWVDLKAILSDLGITHDQFIDACLLCGFEYCQTFPAFAKEYTFRMVCDVVKMNQSGLDTIRSFSHIYPNLDKYAEQFLKTKCLIHNHLVFYSNCVCEPLFKDIYQNKPMADLNQIFGPRLPNDLYFYISQGVISPQVINNLISGFLIEPYPTVESAEYCRMLDYLNEVRTKTLGLLSSCLNIDLKHKMVKTLRWYDPKEFEMNHQTSIVPQHMDQPKLSKELINQIKSACNNTTNNNHTNSNNKSSITFQFVTKQQSLNSQSTSSPESTENNTPIKDIDEATFIILQQSLSLMGYVNNNDGKLSQFGKLVESSTTNPKLQEPIILLIELLRAGSITSDKLNFIPKPSFEGYAATPSTLLISRILSLVPCNLNNEPWGGPIDHDLMGFHEITRTLYKSLRNLLEISSLSHFLTHRIALDPSEYFKFSTTRLPFFLQPSSGMGLLVKGILLENLSLEQLESVFPNCTNIKEDLDTASEFWDQTIKIVEALHKEGIVDKKLYDSFLTADTDWKKSRPN